MKNYMGEGYYPKYGTHYVRAYLQWDDYKGRVVLELGGNCMGGSILTSIISALEDGDYFPDMTIDDNLKHIETDEDGYPVEYTLFNENGDELYLEADGDFGDCVVGVEIIDWIEEKKAAG
ncbi:DUF5406 family protein [Paenibacillus sp. GYB003]|uniref:DUF5406 family protein n=1 Tax=Paenibacillus sp. GYB003 TaxID=2994392 RepID=UPI002F96344A